MNIHLKHNYIDVATKGGYHFYGGSQLLFDDMIRRCGCSLIAAADVILYIRGRRKPIELDDYKTYVEKLSPAFPYIPYKGIPGFVLAMYLNVYFRMCRLDYHAHFGGLGSLSAYIKGLRCRLGGKNRISDILSSCTGRHIREALADDLPVILCIGPGVHQTFRHKEQKGLMLYSTDTDTANAAGSDGSNARNAQASGSADRRINPDMRGSDTNHSNTAAINNESGSTASKKTGSLVPVKKVRSHFVVITAIDEDNDLLTVSSWGTRYYIRLSELSRYSAYDMCGLYTNIICLKRKHR